VRAPPLSPTSATYQSHPSIHRISPLSTRLHLYSTSIHLAPPPPFHPHTLCLLLAVQVEGATWEDRALGPRRGGECVEHAEVHEDSTPNGTPSYINAHAQSKKVSQHKPTPTTRRAGGTPARTARRRRRESRERRRACARVAPPPPPSSYTSKLLAALHVGASARVYARARARVRAPRRARATAAPPRRRGHGSRWPVMQHARLRM
jgi:hypothetical protein